MATERLPMKQALEILRLKWELRLSNRHTARSAGVSPATVVNVVRRAIARRSKCSFAVVASPCMLVTVGIDIRRWPEHMPSAHRQHAAWSPSRILNWASKLGPATHALCSAILAERPHPEQGFRSCLGILRLAKKYGDARVESACARRVAAHARSYRSVESVLKAGLDAQPVSENTEAEPVIEHENVRGPDYFVN